MTPVFVNAKFSRGPEGAQVRQSFPQTKRGIFSHTLPPVERDVLDVLALHTTSFAFSSPVTLIEIPFICIILWYPRNLSVPTVGTTAIHVPVNFDSDPIELANETLWVVLHPTWSNLLRPNPQNPQPALRWSTPAVWRLCCGHPSM